MVKVDDKRWRESVPDLLSVVRAAARAAWEDEPEAEISVLLTHDAAIADLNGRWRGRDGPTNVLSFPGETDADLAGDVVIAYDTVAREAADEGVTVTRHLVRMLVHGVMHLRGYDHIGAADAKIMEAKEKKINCVLHSRLGI